MQDAICEKVQLWKEGKYPYLIHEFKHSLFVVGEHQFYEGYCLLYHKAHVREQHELDLQTHLECSRELYLAAQAVVATFKPWKINYQSLGNKAQHIHWHIIPRYETDPYHKEQPFYEIMREQKDLQNYNISGKEAQAIADKIRVHLKLK